MLQYQGVVQVWPATHLRKLSWLDLATTHPELAREAFGWDPSTVVAGTHQKKEWKCKEGHIYVSRVRDRTSRGRGCAVCSNQKVLAGFNDLQTKFPDIAAEAYKWDPTAVTKTSGQKRDWKCNNDHIYHSTVANRTSRGDRCPFCSGRQVLKGFNDLQTKFPDIAAEAYRWDPITTTAGSVQRKNWKCKEGHIYSSTINNRTNGKGCPTCAEHGFNPGKDAWFYLMQRPGEQQLGITNGHLEKS